LNLHSLMPALPPLPCPSVLTAVLRCTSSYSIWTHTHTHTHNICENETKSLTLEGFYIQGGAEKRENLKLMLFLAPNLDIQHTSATSHTARQWNVCLGIA
jgi:hypothetical protein